MNNESIEETTEMELIVAVVDFFGKTNERDRKKWGTGEDNSKKIGTKIGT